MRKTLALLLAGLLAILTGCAGNGGETLVSGVGADRQTEAAETAPTPTLPAVSADEPDSRTNGMRQIVDGDTLYYNLYDPDGLRRSTAPFTEDTLLYKGGYNYLSLAGDTLYFWNYSEELYRVVGDGEAELLYDPSADLDYFDLSGSWYNGGKLYFLAQQDFLTNTLRIYDCETGEVTITDLTFDNIFPELLVYGGWVYYTRHMKDGEYTDLCRASLSDLSQQETVAEKASVCGIFDGVLYYSVLQLTLTEEDDPPEGEAAYLWQSLVTGETGSLPEGASNCYWVEDGYVYCRGQGEEPSVERIPLAGGEAETLFTGARPSNLLVKVGDYLYMDYFNGTSTKYYLTEIGQPEAVPASEVLPYAEPDATTKPSDIVSTRDSSLYLTAGEQSRCFKLVSELGLVQFQVKVSPNHSITKSFPAGKYVLHIAQGDTWISDEEAFGEEGEYSYTDLFYFAPGMTYTIGTGSTGNVHGGSQGGFTK